MTTRVRNDILPRFLEIRCRAEGPPLPLLAHGEPAAMPAPLFFARFEGPMPGVFLDDASRRDV